MEENLSIIRSLLYERAMEISAFLSAHQETILLAFCAGLLSAAVWFISGQWHERRAGKREMAQRRRELELKAYEWWLDITLEKYAKGEISDNQQAYLDYKFARAFNNPEMLPKKSQDYITRRLKSFLIWKRQVIEGTVTVPEEMREKMRKHHAPVTIPGPKPGEEVKVVDISTPAAKQSVKERLARAFSRKKAA